MLTPSIALHKLLAAQRALFTPGLQLGQPVVTPHPPDRPRLKADDGHGSAIMLVQRFCSAANGSCAVSCRLALTA